MYRRKPTRIELKVEDLQEYDAIKKEMEQKNALADKDTEVMETHTEQQLKNRQALINERIGYKPQPRVSNWKHISFLKNLFLERFAVTCTQSLLFAVIETVERNTAQMS